MKLDRKRPPEKKAKQNVLQQQVDGLLQLGCTSRSTSMYTFQQNCIKTTARLTTSLVTTSLSFTSVSSPSSHTSPSSHRRSSQSRPSLVLNPHISRPLRCSKQQDFPRAGGGGSRVESLIAGAGDDHYLVILAQVDTPGVQQSLKVCQQILRCLPRYQCLWHGSVSHRTPLTGLWRCGGLTNQDAVAWLSINTCLDLLYSVNLKNNGETSQFACRCS